MSRVIKYRTWWKGATYGKDVYPARWRECIVIPNGTLAEEDYELMTISNPEDYVVEQWTGLLDKEGKEIYEGDILRVARWDGTQVIYDQVGVVYWWQQAGRFSIATDGGRGRIAEINTSSGGMLDEKTRDEVIGNVHEHPELLAARQS